MKPAREKSERLAFDDDGVLTEDPRGLKVTYPAEERASGLLLGDVVGWHTGRNILTGKTDTWLKVRHFNGEPWPFQPRAADVEVIRATFPVCDRRKKRDPDLCEDNVETVSCECGKVYGRCGSHGGHDGALRSRSAHRALGCAAWEASRGVEVVR